MQARCERNSTRRGSGAKMRGMLLVLSALLLAGCEGITKISEVKNDPSKYRDKTVRVMGTVTNSVGVLSTGGYEIEDDTGRIFVLSNQGVPARGATVVVEGTVFTGAMVLGQAVGVSIRERHHQVRQ